MARDDSRSEHLLTLALLDQRDVRLKLGVSLGIGQIDDFPLFMRHVGGHDEHGNEPTALQIEQSVATLFESTPARPVCTEKPPAQGKERMAKTGGRMV